MNSIAVIRARLPYVDRRALSEAWFSTLHLAREGERLARRRLPITETLARGGGTFAHGATAARGGATLPSRAPAPSAGRRPERQSSARGGTSSTDGTSPPSRARQCRAAEARRFNDARSSFSIELAGGGRVQILLRREGRVLHVIALCSEGHVELVRRALACADLHLRARGEKVSSSVRAL